ncbi:RNA polymerase subunit sigma-54 [Thermocrinis minervae]|uniref:RNA polymerase, sigma 54 subunit, RpoN/SigL n=1 Tax=Thermocrinis minervae TaxID=381751 RepID=A0A1M6TC82_9AQUI|nr:RNA polymerase subunit sigma-54 [Thermocrinis minervae]SHK54378.1 RNA polymerase, sigma 54 subunit, RpoN/SigL [Thermocrinis minervae]
MQSPQVKPELHTKLQLNLTLGVDIKLLQETSEDLSKVLEEESRKNPCVVRYTRRIPKFFYEEIPRQEVAARESHMESLIKQAKLEFDGQDLDVALEIIYSLDAKGFLGESVEDIAKRFGTEPQYVESIRRFITREFEPLGVASKDIKEFLVLQVEELYPSQRHLIPKLLKALESRRPVRDQEVLSLLSTLKLFPLSTDAAYTHTSVDVVAEYENGEWYLFVYEDFVDFDVEKRDGDWERAKRLKMLLEMRRKILRDVSYRIIHRQEGFLLRGEPLKALKVSSVAKDIGIDTSTLSRIISRKSIKTPAGTYPLRFFFVRESKSGLSTQEVMLLVRKILEEKGMHLSDREVSLEVKKLGFNLARRTVAKYRRLLGLR